MAEDMDQAHGHTAMHWWHQAEKATEATEKIAAKHAALLERVSGLRVGVVEVMRRAWPGHVKGVEQALGSKMSDVPDSVLLGYMDAFAAMSSAGRAATPNDLVEISRALKDCGFELGEHATAVDMAVAIRSGFAAAKSENARLRKRKKQDGQQRSPIERDLSWAEPQETNGEWATTTPKGSRTTTKPSGSKQRKPAKDSPLPLVQDAPLLPDEDPAVPASIRQQIEATLAIAAPRFMQDVVAMCDNAAQAAAWEKKQRQSGLVSLINPQTKYRQRGALLVQSEELRNKIPNFHSSVWGRALAESYPAGRLYELALVLRILGDKIIAAGFRKHSVEITYRVSHGVSALVLGLAPGPDPWADVCESVHSFTKVSDLHQIEVVSCPRNSENIVRAALEAEAKYRGWDLSTPITVQDLQARVQDGGRSAQSVRRT